MSSGVIHIGLLQNSQETIGCYELAATSDKLVVAYKHYLVILVKCLACLASHNVRL